MKVSKLLKFHKAAKAIKATQIKTISLAITTYGEVGDLKANIILRDTTISEGYSQSIPLFKDIIDTFKKSAEILPQAALVRTGTNSNPTQELITEKVIVESLDINLLKTAKRFAAQHDEALAGVHIDQKRGKLVATNGKIMYIHPIDICDFMNMNVLIPLPIIEAASKLFDFARLSVGADSAGNPLGCFSGDGFSLIFNMTDKEYPNYSQCVPSQEVKYTPFTPSIVVGDKYGRYEFSEGAVRHIETGITVPNDYAGRPLKVNCETLKALQGLDGLVIDDGSKGRATAWNGDIMDATPIKCQAGEAVVVFMSCA